MKLSSILSSVLAGGLLFGSALSLADRDVPRPPPPAPAPAPPHDHQGPRPPRPPKPPRAPHAGSGLHIQINGLDDMINGHIEGALDMVRTDRNLPPAVREKITKRLEKLRGKITKRLGKGDLDPEELEQLGEEIGAEMEEFGEEMEKWGEQFGRDFEKKFGNFNVHVDVDHDDDNDSDDDDDDRDPPDFDDARDVDDAIRDIGRLNLKPAQRDQIKKLRADSDAKATAAERELARAEAQLEQQLATGATDADIARSIDAVTQQEAAIRKARILAWVNARRILDDAQRKKIEAARGKTK